MVGQQTVGVNADGKTFAGGFQIFQKSFAVADTFKYVFTGITAIDYVVKGAWIFYAQRSDHGRKPLRK